MNKMIEPSWDSSKFYLNEQSWPFQILDQSSAEGSICISLAARLQDDCLWLEEKKKAFEIKKRGGKILWELDFGFHNLQFPLSHPMQFESFSLAIEHFREHVFKEFQLESLGVILYRDPIDLSHSFLWDERQTKDWKDWVEERFPVDVSNSDEILHLYRLFRLNSLVDYLSLFACKLPESLPIILLINVEKISSSSRALYYLSKERFEHFLLGVKGGKVPFHAFTWEKGLSRIGWLAKTPLIVQPSQVKIGVCFPIEERVDEDCLIHFDKLFNQLNEKDIAYRILYERFLTEDWQEIDFIIFSSQYLSESGKRKLQGFCAAAGTGIYYDEPLDLTSETSFTDFISSIKNQHGIKGEFYL